MSNPYLEKVASSEEKNKDKIKGWKRAGTVIGTSMAGTVGGQALGLTALPAIRKSNPKSRVTEADLKSYVRAKKLRHIVRNDGPDLGAHYHPAGIKGFKRPHVTGSSPEILMHEYGHAHSINGTRKRFGSKGVKGKFAGISAAQQVVMGPGTFAGTYAATSNNEKVRKYAPVAVAAATTPLLVEEARASISPVKHLWKTKGRGAAMDMLKRVGPAYGTYVAGAAGAVGAAKWAQHIKNKNVAKAQGSK